MIAVIAVALLPVLGLGLFIAVGLYSMRDKVHGDEPWLTTTTTRTIVSDQLDHVVLTGWKGLTIHGLASRDWDVRRATVVFVHGFPDDASVWRQVMHHFEDGQYNVLAVTLRGFHVDSLAEDNDYSTYAAAQDIIHILQDRKLFGANTPVHLVGHDWGSLVAQIAVKQAPEAFRSLTLVSIPHMRRVIKGLRRVPEQIYSFGYMLLMCIPAVGVWWLRGGYRGVLSINKSKSRKVPSKRVSKSSSKRVSTSSSRRASTSSTKRLSTSSTKRLSASSTKQSMPSRKRSSTAADESHLVGGATFLVNGGSTQPYDTATLVAIYDKLNHPKVSHAMASYYRQNILPPVVPWFAHSWLGQLCFGPSVKLGLHLAARTRIEVPTLIVTGVEDRFFVHQLFDVVHPERDFPGGKSTVKLDGAGHWPMREQPKLLHNVLESFFMRQHSGVADLMQNLSLRDVGIEGN